MNNDKLVYEIDWLIEYIYRESDKLLNHTTDPTKFELRCIKDIGDYIAKSELHKKNKRYLIRLVNRKAEETKRVNKKESAQLMSELAIESKDGQIEEFEPKDVLADVESNLMAKEMTALLAQDDQRKEFIVGCWSIGNENNLLISRLLAQTFGGTVEAHRKFINRFRKDCYEYLSRYAVAN